MQHSRRKERSDVCIGMYSAICAICTVTGKLEHAGIKHDEPLTASPVHLQDLIRIELQGKNCPLYIHISRSDPQNNLQCPGQA